MTDGSSFIHALNIAHPLKIPALLGACTDEQLWAVKNMIKHTLTGKIKVPPGSIPPDKKTLLLNLARKTDAKSLRRSINQRGGSKAQIIGSIFKTMAKVASPMLKKGAKKLLRKGVETGINTATQLAVDKLSPSSSRSSSTASSAQSTPTSSPTSSAASSPTASAASSPKAETEYERLQRLLRD